MTGHPETAPPTCTCLPPWPALATIIEGTTHPVVPSPAHTHASALYLAHCTGCGTAYTGSWKRLTPSFRAA
ncbi:hypothetical protein OIE73_39815 [Streptomyces hirsutus]|uniref:Uncharacterized protein n=1 Tax=Streptomyces hirsutus TaxID=35620 RepID=A0ABZ1H1E6_9ACTN|nr:hypothetical protein [Streptomyces hirsutus]WSD11200.1 hypothetical protein OIE73_39815 [Streptomyces hirsutus]